ncbi:MAG: M28 family peptidase, partial [Candidatus Thermoplasmatota archaeon]|nr:M28 family peptidase [Candidatus Thermoplasmatota archaeon]
MRSRLPTALLLVFLLLCAPLSGCFGSEDTGAPGPKDLDLTGSLVAGDWSEVTLLAKKDLSVYIPYFVVDPGSTRAQNGTVLDLKSGAVENVRWLLPPRNPIAMVLIGDYGRTDWPVRAANESWQNWRDDPSNGGAVTVAENGDNGAWVWLATHDSDGGSVGIKDFETERPQRSDLTMDEGVDASDGWVDGRSVYDWVDFITDDTPCVTCGPDGAVGYLDRWIGNANPSYEHAITYFEGVMKGYNLDRVEVHRFQSNTAWAVNICGYKDGSVYPDEWLIFGAHFDIAPPVAFTPGAEIGVPGYGTRHGAYDNAAGSSMVLSTAEVLAEFDARRTMVFCLWSSEEEGLWGSRSFANDLPDDVTVSNYLNLDMAGVNFPGDYALSVYL